MAGDIGPIILVIGLLAAVAGAYYYRCDIFPDMCASGAPAGPALPPPVTQIASAGTRNRNFRGGQKPQKLFKDTKTGAVTSFNPAKKTQQPDASGNCPPGFRKDTVFGGSQQCHFTGFARANFGEITMNGSRMSIG